jgi:predicted short-subunit dehydrogenase-like oxidoreductase (DUF2520 family)
MTKIVLLGAGNVGTHLFRAMQNKEDLQLIQWYNRSLNCLEKESVPLEVTYNLNDIIDADLYIISVSDSVIPLISKALEGKKGVIAHTAGSISMEVLEAHENHGIFYPLQTFSKQKEVDFNQIPLCLEANLPENLNLLKRVAQAVGGPVHLINSAQRKALHVAAVFVNNFTNHLYTIGEELCKAHKVPFSVLQPLIAETANKIKLLPPSLAQTGPAARGDQKILEDHLQYLTKESHQKLYQLISASIQQQ